MARWPALLLLAALAFANAQSGIAACGYREWQCSNGECINAVYRCDGVRQCSDGSDEEAAMCVKMPSVRVQVGQVTTVRAEFKEEHAGFFFFLCGGTTCSLLGLMGRTADGALAYAAGTCDAGLSSCEQDRQSEPKGWQNFTDGPLVFKAERRPGELAVWLDGHENKAAYVPVEEGSDLLKVRPAYWTTDLAVQFELSCMNGGTLSGGACICKPDFMGVSCNRRIAACGYREWQCGNGECINAVYRCDGERQCSDGSDEEAAMCDKMPSVRVQVGQVTTVRAEFKEEHAGFFFFLCGGTTCSLLGLMGRTADGALAYVAAMACEAYLRDCGGSHQSIPKGWQNFPDGPLVFKAERRPGELAVWLDGHEDKAAYVPVEEGSDLLKVRPAYWTTDLPVQFELSCVNGGTTSDGICICKPGFMGVSCEQVADVWEPSYVPDFEETDCANGGTTLKTASGDACICRPGFRGTLCEQACGPDRFGKDCERRCSALSGASPRGGCSGLRFYEFGSSSGKSVCAAGFQGPRCEQVCDGTRYGADCSEACGRCGGEGHCDPYTGECYAGCLPGYHGANCKQAFSYLVAEPNVTRVTSDSVEGSVLLQGNTAGSGAVKYLQLQSRVPGGDWSRGAVVEVQREDIAVPFAVEGLPADSDVELRAVLLDERMRGRANAPQVRLRTPQGILWDVVATEAGQGSVQVAWQQSNRSMPVVVEYQCEAVAGCPGRCGPPGAVQVAGEQAALLQGLLAAAQYRITVRAGREAQSLTFLSALRAPNVTLAFAEVQATNATALAQWRSPNSCLRVGGPWHSFRWQLVSNSSGEIRQSGSSSDTVLLLENLQPGTEYELQVAVTNPLGASRWAAVYFTTQENAPSAPQDLAAYRWNRTSLSLVWRAPARPNGRLRNYWVSVDGLPEQQVVAENKCAAWPEMVCYAARLPRGKPASNMHSVVVAATNDKQERHGDEARIEVDATNAKPDPVLGLEAHPSTDAVRLAWRLPRHLRGDLMLFVVEVTRLADGSSDESSPDPDPVTLLAREELPLYESVVSGLLANATYSATVRCDATGGSSDASVQFSTLSAPKVASSENGPDFGTY